MADNKIMVNSSGNQPGREVPVATDISSNELEKRIGADAYSDFGSSMTKSYETYPNRMDALVNALGNKDSIKG